MSKKSLGRILVALALMVMLAPAGPTLAAEEPPADGGQSFSWEVWSWWTRVLGGAGQQTDLVEDPSPASEPAPEGQPMTASTEPEGNGGNGISSSIDPDG